VADARQQSDVPLLPTAAFQTARYITLEGVHLTIPTMNLFYFFFFFLNLPVFDFLNNFLHDGKNWDGFSGAPRTDPAGARHQTDSVSSAHKNPPRDQN
jgi:hypothetical protein